MRGSGRPYSPAKVTSCAEGFGVVAALRGEDVRVTTSWNERALVARVSGVADLMTAPRLTAALERVLQQCPGRLVLDLSAVGFCDVRGLTVLLHARTKASRRGVRFATAGASRLLIREWTLLRPFDAHLHHPNVAEAVGALDQPAAR